MLTVLVSSAALFSHFTVPPVVTEAIELVREHLFDPDRVENRWSDLDSYLAQPEIMTKPSSQIINELLGRLEVSHTAHFANDTQAYYELLDIYSTAGIGAQVANLFPDGVFYVGVGMVTTDIDGMTFISDIWPNGPAQCAGLRIGDEIVTANDRPFHPIHSFAEKESKRVELTIRTSHDAAVTHVTIVPQRIRPADAYEDALRASAQVHIVHEAAIGYIRPISYAGRRYHDAIIEELSGPEFRDAHGLILDLRGGWGGASPEFAELFLGGAPNMSFFTRDGNEFVVNTRWRKPLVVLIDQGTRSGKEVLAYAFKQAGIPLIGTTTAGAVVGGRPFLLSDNSLLIVATADVIVDGARVEGVGVSPTVFIDFDLRYAGGADPQLAAATEHLLMLIGE